MSDYDALADLFLNTAAASRSNESRASKTAAPEPVKSADAPAWSHLPRKPHIEALLVGNLPVFASAWVAPYAKHLADVTGEPVCLVRIHADSTRIDIAMPRGTPAPIAKVYTSLRDAASFAVGLCPRVLVRAEERYEEQLCREPGLDGFTLLTGADDAALVSGYALLKLVAQPPDQSHTQDVGDERTARSLSLAIVGAPPDRAHAAEHSLRKASHAFLGQEIGAASHVQRVGPTTLTPLYRGMRCDDIGEVLALVGHFARGPVYAEALQERELQDERFAQALKDVICEGEQSATRPSPRSTLRLANSADDEGATPLATMSNAEHAVPLVEAKPSVVSRDGAGATRSHAGMNPLPRQDIDMSSPRAITQESAPQVSPPGLIQLATTCPYAPDVRLGADDAKQLHVFLGSYKSHVVRDPAGQLLRAASWAHDHADLLVRAHPDTLACWGPGSDATLHLVTDDASLARSMLTTGIRVHAAARTGNGDAPAWVCITLNAPDA
jgi:hypothetical protein